MQYSYDAIREIGKKLGRPSTKGVKGMNFMTPYILGTYTNNGVTFELSTGKGFNGDQLIGVTFLPPHGVHSSCCYSLKEVEDLVSKVMEESK